jgi:PucR family transcriptional regulator, purine catabolism regulatory protein
VETVSGEITLYDLIAWEPRLRPIAPLPGTPNWRSLTGIEVDWILTARSSQPILPTLRGGELIVLSDRIVREIGVPLPALIREISSQPIAGILTDHLGIPDPESEIAVIHTPLVDAETERDLNRLLTNGRRDALQRIAELDQAIAEAGARGSRPSELIDRLSQLLGVPITVHTPGATTLFTTGNSRDEPTVGSNAWIRANLRSGYTVWLGPIPPSRHALARFAINHVRDSLQRALDSTLNLMPRGNARVAALNALLREPDSANRDRLAQKAMNAGIPPDRLLRVACSHCDVPETQVRRALQQLGDVLDAGEIDGYQLWLLASRASMLTSGRVGSAVEGWIAVSAPVDSPGDLPEATRQARYVSALLADHLVEGPTVSFDNPSALGIYGLLYQDWDSESQRAYRDQHLGTLLENDPRGQLADTLGTFLDQGGSQRLAAEALGIHRNTLSYRLRQINASLPVDLDDPHTRLTLHVAIAIHRIVTL